MQTEPGKRLRTISSWLGGGLLLIIASVGHAARYPVQGTLSFSVAELAPFGIDASFSVVITTTAQGRVGAVSVPASVFSTTAFALDITLTSASPIDGLAATVGNQRGSFKATSGPGWGEMRLGGLAKICLYADCTTFVPANISIPLGVVGAADETYGGDFVNLTVGGGPWVTASPRPFQGTLHGPLSASHSVAQIGGVLQLVTPIFISTNIVASASIPAQAILNLRIVPEPSTTLLGGMIVALALGERALRRRRETR